MTTTVTAAAAAITRPSSEPTVRQAEREGSEASNIADFAQRVASTSKSLRSTGQWQLRVLRRTSAAVDRAIVAAAYEAPSTSIRVAPVNTLAATMRTASALMKLPPSLAGEAAGVLIGLAGADCYGDPERMEIMVGAEVIDAIDDAETALDDALVMATLERRDSRAARSRQQQAADNADIVAALTAEVQALSALHEAMRAAMQAITRADQLIADLERLPQLLRITSSARPHAAEA